MITQNKKQFTAVYKKTKDWIITWVEEIPGVNTQGKTMKEAVENLEEALKLVVPKNKHKEIDWGKPVGREVW